MEAASDQERLFEKLKAAGQGHLAEHYSEIADEVVQKNYLQQLQNLDLSLAATVL